MIVAVQPAKETSVKSGELTPSFTRTREPIVNLLVEELLMRTRALLARKVRRVIPAAAGRGETIVTESWSAKRLAQRCTVGDILDA